MEKPVITEKTEAFKLKENALAEMLPPGYTIVSNDTGEELQYHDLNGDGKLDVALLLEMRGDTSYDFSEEVLLLIAHGAPGGYLEIAAVSEHLGGESISYTGVKHLAIDKGVISYFHQSMRHDAALKFRYDAKQQKYTLIGMEYREYGGINDGPRQISINYLTGVKQIQDSKWNEVTEEVEPLPQQSISIANMQTPLTEMNWERIYQDL